MAIGKRIKFFRNRKGMTQKQLGEILGFLGKTSDVRMAQYESEARIPKHDLVKEMANLFGVNTHALTVPDIDTNIGLMHTFFALEDIYGLKIGEIDGEPCLRLDKSDEWHYKYPDLDTRQIWAKVPPQELFDFINKTSNETETTEKKEAKTRKKK